MKKNLSLIISVACLAGIAFLFFMQIGKTEKLAYLDNVKLLEKYQGMIDARKDLEKSTKLWKANIDTLALDFEKELKKYEKERASLSEKERALTEQLLNNKQQQYSQYREAMQQKAGQEENKITSEVLNKLNDFIKEYGKKQGYKIIFGANSSGNIVYADNTLEITDEIIKVANAVYTKK